VDQLQEDKIPFGEAGQHMEANTHFAAYQNALMYGISDTQLAFPEASRPLKERAEHFVRCLEWWRRRKEEDAPVLVTYDWLKQAARVKRRVLAGGGEDRWLYERCCEHIDSLTKADPARRLLPEERAAKWALQRCFLWTDGEFELRLPNADNSRERHGPSG
jgi:hypothetical protein